MVSIVGMLSTKSHFLILLLPQSQASTEDVKTVISQLSELRYQLLTDKPMEPVIVGDDLKEWDSVFDTYRKKFKGENPKWFSVSWLFAECFMYRKIAQIFRNRFVRSFLLKFPATPFNFVLMFLVVF